MKRNQALAAELQYSGQACTRLAWLVHTQHSTGFRTRVESNARSDRVIQLDIKSFFDSDPHEIEVRRKAHRSHRYSQPLLALRVRRVDGEAIPRSAFERYCDDAVVHCKLSSKLSSFETPSAKQAGAMWSGVASRQDAHRVLQGRGSPSYLCQRAIRLLGVHVSSSPEGQSVVGARSEAQQRLSVQPFPRRGSLKPVTSDKSLALSQLQGNHRTGWRLGCNQRQVPSHSNDTVTVMAYLKPLALLVAFFLTAWLWFFSDQKWFALLPLAAAIIIGLSPLFRR